MPNLTADGELDLNPNKPSANPAGPDTPSAPITPPAPGLPHDNNYQQPTPQPPTPPVPHYQWTPPSQPNEVYEPTSPYFNPSYYNDRFKAIYFHLQHETGVQPNTDVMNDFVRSGIPAQNLGDVWDYMLKNTTTPMAAGTRDQTMADLPIHRTLPPQLQAQIEDKPVINAPNAPHSGLKYDATRDAFINNPTSPAPPHVDIQQVVKGALHDKVKDWQTYGQMLAGIRAIRPDLVAQYYNLHDKKDYEGAVAAMAAEDPRIADLVANRLGIELPGGYSSADEDKWQAAMQKLETKQQTPLADSALGVAEGVTQLPVLKQWGQAISWLTEHTLYPAIVKPLSALYAETATPQDQIARNLAEIDGAMISVGGRGERIDPTKLQQYREEADQIYQQLQAEGTNKLDGIELYKTGQEAGNQTYADWAKENPGAAMGLDIVNPAAWLGPGEAIRAGKLAIELPRALAAMREDVRLAALARAANDEAKSKELRAVADVAIKNRDKTQASLDRIGQSTDTFHYYGTSPERAQVIRQTGQIEAEQGQSVLVNSSISQARKSARENGSVFAVRTGDLPDQRIGFAGSRQKGPIPTAYELPISSAKRSDNVTILRGMIGEFKDVNEQLKAAMAAGETDKQTLNQLTKAAQTKEIRLNALVNNPREFDNKPAAIERAKTSLAGGQQKLAEHQTLMASRNGDSYQKVVDQLQKRQDSLIDQMNHHIENATLPTHASARKIEEEISDLQLSARRITASKNLRGMNPDVIDFAGSEMLDRITEARGRLLDAISPTRYLEPVRKLLQKQWVEQAEEATRLENQAQLHSDMLSRIIASSEKSHLGRTYKSIISNWHQLDHNLNNPNSLVSNGLRLINSGKILRQNIEADLTKLLKEGSDRAMFQSWIEHPDTIPENVSDKVSEAITETRAALADAGYELTDKEIIDELVPEYFPRWSQGQQQLFRAAVGYRGELPITGSFAKPRVLEEAGATLPAEKAIGEYFQAVTRIIANRHIRAGVKEMQLGDRPVFISKNVVPQSAGKPAAELTGGKLYVYRDTMGGWVDKQVSDLLDQIAAPTRESGGNIDFIKRWNNRYKSLAMKIPLVHTWNQLSAGFGVGMGPLVNIPLGAIISKNPEALALASREMFLQPSKMIADSIQKLVSDNPEAQELAEAMGWGMPKQTRVGAAADHFLWDSVVRNQQIGVWWVLRSKLIRDGYAEKDAGIAAGTLASQIAGIADPKLLQKWEKTLKDYWFFAYSWNKKHVTIPSEALNYRFAQKISPELSQQQAQLVTQLARRYMLRYMVMAPATLFGAQMLTNGTPFWENEDGHQLDLEWTKLHDLIYGPDGQRHYINWPAMNFARFYTSKAQLFADDGPIGGGLANFANISMPIPSFVAANAMNWRNLSVPDVAGSLVQQADPWDRNLVGPIVKSVRKSGQGTANPIDIPLSFLGLTGLHTYQGPHKPFTLTDQQDAHQRSIDLELALHMGVNPLDASNDQKAEAERRLAGESMFGVPEFLMTAGGGPPGSGSPLNGLDQELSTRIDQAVINEGFMNAEQVDAFNKNPPKGEDGKRESIFKQLTTAQVKTLFADNPDIQWALNAHSDNPDKTKQQASDAKAAYFNGLSKIQSRAVDEQKVLDDGLARWYASKGKEGISPSDWRTQRKANRAREAQDVEGLQQGVPKSVWDPNAKDPNANQADQAYAEYHAISLDDSKYQNKDGQGQWDGTINIKQWQADRNALLQGFSPDVQDYIAKKDNQNRTDTEKKYETAVVKYGQFLDEHTWLNNQETMAMKLTSTERRIYLQLHPEIVAYMKLKDNWWTKNPDVASFFKPQDEYQWNGMSPDEQAVKAADWMIEYSIGHPEYLTAWQLKLVTDPATQKKMTEGWSADQMALYLSYLEQDTIDYYNKYRRRGGSRFSAYGGQTNYYKHYYNVPYSQQPNIFAGSTGGSQGYGAPAQSIF